MACTFDKRTHLMMYPYSVVTCRLDDVFAPEYGAGLHDDVLAFMRGDGAVGFFKVEENGGPDRPDGYWPVTFHFTDADTAFHFKMIFG